MWLKSLLRISIEPLVPSACVCEDVETWNNCSLIVCRSKEKLLIVLTSACFGSCDKQILCAHWSANKKLQESVKYTGVGKLSILNTALNVQLMASCTASSWNTVSVLMWRPTRHKNWENVFLSWIEGREECLHSSWSDCRQSGASSVKLRFVRELQRTQWTKATLWHWWKQTYIKEVGNEKQKAHSSKHNPRRQTDSSWGKSY